eukprot:TRINITY_DN6022_c1_g1_i1.p1 TRINITY_DN6022_c1_g1~~TRINITY_DN6022_c1_g1_i1.p1  ORF type:complete len:269 (+),score=30.05 TRINITY_DN6022_c1_g1_i1:54-809(+)
MAHNVHHVNTTTETHTYTTHSQGNPMVGIDIADIADIVGAAHAPPVQNGIVPDQRLIQIIKGKRFIQDGSKWVLQPTPNYMFWITLAAALVSCVLPVVLLIILDTWYPVISFIVPLILFFNIPGRWGNYSMVFDDATQTVTYEGRGCSCLAKKATVRYSDCVRINSSLRVVSGHRNGWRRSYYVYVLATVTDNLKFMSKEDNLDLDALNAFLAERLSIGNPEMNNAPRYSKHTYSTGPPNPMMNAFPDSSE